MSDTTTQFDANGWPIREPAGEARAVKSSGPTDSTGTNYGATPEYPTESDATLPFPMGEADPRLHAIATDKLTNAGIPPERVGLGPVFGPDTSFGQNQQGDPTREQYAAAAAAFKAPTPIRLPSRAAVAEARRREREQGVPFPLEKTSKALEMEVIAQVRDLPFTDRIMLNGIPADLRNSLNRAMGLAEAADVTNVNDIMDAMASLDDLAKALCIAGFISPRLVQHEAQTQGDDCWWVEDIHPDERDAYREFVMRDRTGTQEVERLATFPGTEVAQAPTG